MPGREAGQVCPRPPVPHSEVARGPGCFVVLIMPRYGSRADAGKSKDGRLVLESVDDLAQLVEGLLLLGERTDERELQVGYPAGGVGGDAVLDEAFGSDE